MNKEYKETISQAIDSLDAVIIERLEEYIESSIYRYPKDIIPILELRKGLVEIYKFNQCCKHDGK